MYISDKTSHPSIYLSYFIQENRLASSFCLWSVQLAAMALALPMSMRFGKLRTVDLVFLLISVQWLTFTEAKVKSLIHFQLVENIAMHVKALYQSTMQSLRSTATLELGKSSALSAAFAVKSSSDM